MEDKKGNEGDEIFKTTTRLGKAIAAINTLKPNLLQKILVRLVKKVAHISRKEAAEKIFSDKDLEQLAKMMKLTSEQLEMTLEACTYIFQKAAYFKLKPTDLVRRLVQTLKMEKEQSTMFGQVWAKESSELTEKLSKHTLGGPLVLTGTDWQVALQVAQQSKRFMYDPKAIFSLSLADEVGSDAVEHCTMEFSSDELSSFFRQIETVQKQLDQLGVQ